MSAANLQNSIQKLADDVQAEVKRTTPKEYGICFTIAFLLCLIYSAMFRDKETHLLNFGVFFYSTVLMLLSIVLRVKTSENQYPWSVVIITFFAIFYPLNNMANLALGVVPVIINIIRHEIKST